MTVVISEETGEVSVTQNNELLRNMTQNDYLKFFRNELIQEHEPENRNIFTWLVDSFDHLFRGGGAKKNEQLFQQ